MLGRLRRLCGKPRIGLTPHSFSSAPHHPICLWLLFAFVGCLLCFSSRGMIVLHLVYMLALYLPIQEVTSDGTIPHQSAHAVLTFHCMESVDFQFCHLLLSRPVRVLWMNGRSSRYCDLSRAHLGLHPSPPAPRTLLQLGQVSLSFAVFRKWSCWRYFHMFFYKSTIPHK